MSIACVSGYFDPIHIGHIEYFKLSKKSANKLIFIVNNDEQATLKNSLQNIRNSKSKTYLFL